MANCLKCAAVVKEEKAFCHNCGSPMNPAPVQPHAGGMDFGATMVEPPKRSYAPPVAPDVQHSHTGTANAMYPAGGALLSPPVSPPPPGRRKSSVLSIIGFILLVLFLMLVAFVMGFWLD